jgi:hypothetical protein
VPAEVQSQVARAYEQLALYTEHTWGDHATDARVALPRGNRYTSAVFAGAKPVPPVDRWVASWEDKARYAREADRITTELEERAVSAWSGPVAAGESRIGVALFNSLNWARGGLVKMTARGLPKEEFELVDPTTGGLVLYERNRGRIEFQAPPVPPCGYLFLEVRPVARRNRPGFHSDWDSRNLTLHTHETTFQYHRAGGMSRWHDRARSCQWCSCDVEFPLGTYLYDMPGGDRMLEFARAVHTNCWEGTPGFFHRNDYADMLTFGPAAGSRARIEPEITPLYSRVVVEADCPSRKPSRRRSGDARRYRTTFTYYRERRELHVSVCLTGKRPTYAAEAGYAFFPLIGDHPFMLIDRITQLMEPEQDLAGGVNAAHMAVHHGVRVEGGYAGMNFYPLDTPLVGFGAPGAYRYDEERDRPTGVLYATLFNNCWGTNFAQWQGGDLSYDFVLQPTGNDEWDGGLARGGAEFFRPLTAAVMRLPADEPSRSLLKVDPPAVQLVTLKPASFGPGHVLRLWNSDLDPVRARVTLSAMRRGDAVYRCDLLERKRGRKLAVNGEGELRVPLRGHEIATLLVEPATTRRS